MRFLWCSFTGFLRIEKLVSRMEQVILFDLKKEEGIYGSKSGTSRDGKLAGESAAG